MEILRQYLDIERIRFGDRLQLNFEVAPETLDAAVPSLILQPLVENAIHHGVADIPNAQITVRAIRENGSLRMEVQDNGRGFTTRDSKNAASLGLETHVGVCVCSMAMPNNSSSPNSATEASSPKS